MYSDLVCSQHIFASVIQYWAVWAYIYIASSAEYLCHMWNLTLKVAQTNFQISWENRQPFMSNNYINPITKVVLKLCCVCIFGLWYGHWTKGICLTHWPLRDVFVILKVQSPNTCYGSIHEHFWWNCCQVSTTEHLSWLVNFGSGNGLVSSGNKPLPETMLNPHLSHHMASHNGLIFLRA